MRLVTALLVAIVPCAVSAGTAGDGATPAAAAAAAAEQKMARDLDGHIFMPSHLVDNPFSETYVGNAFGLGTGEALGPSLQLRPPDILPASQWYPYSGVGLMMGGGFRLLENLSLRMSVGTTVYMGSGTKAALSVGTGARSSGGLGLKFGLPVGDNLRLAATFDVTYGPVVSVLIAQGLIDAINSGQITADEFLQSGDTVTWTGGLVGSWAPWAFLGFTLDGRFLVPTKTGKASYSQDGIFVGAMADFDARPIWAWLPLGLNAGYTITAPVGANGVSRLQEFGFGLYYTGRKDLGLGVEVDRRLGRLESSGQESRATLVWLNLKYYFE